MDFRDYSQLPKEQRLLELLMKTQDCQRVMARGDIENIARSVYKKDSLEVDKKIVKSVRIVLKDSTQLESSQYPHKVIQCAKNVLNILKGSETNTKVQSRLEEEILVLDQLQKKIEVFFQIKSLITDPHDLKILDDENFPIYFKKLETICAQQMNIQEIFPILVKLWKNPNTQDVFKKWIDLFQLVKSSHPEGIEAFHHLIEHAVNSTDMIKIRLKLNVMCYHLLQKSEYQKMNVLFNQLTTSIISQEINREERQILSNIYVKSKEFILQNLDQKTERAQIERNYHILETGHLNGKKIKYILPMLPESVASVLDLLDDRGCCPHLSQLKDQQKLDLFQAIIQLAKKHALAM